MTRTARRRMLASLLALSLSVVVGAEALATRSTATLTLSDTAPAAGSLLTISVTTDASPILIGARCPDLSWPGILGTSRTIELGGPGDCFAVAYTVDKHGRERVLDRVTFEVGG